MKLLTVIQEQCKTYRPNKDCSPETDSLFSLYIFDTDYPTQQNIIMVIKWEGQNDISYTWFVTKGLGWPTCGWQETEKLLKPSPFVSVELEVLYPEEMVKRMSSLIGTEIVSRIGVISLFIIYLWRLPTQCFLITWSVFDFYSCTCNTLAQIKLTGLSQLTWHHTVLQEIKSGIGLAEPD